MATTLYFRNTNGSQHFGHGADSFTAGQQPWDPRLLSTTKGSAATSVSTNTVTGLTTGIEVIGGSSSLREWITEPLAADVTISGSITWNLWAAESNMSANVAINGQIEVIDGATGAITLIDKTARTTEVAITTPAVNNFSETPAAGVACKRGDRIRVKIFGDDAGTMASGFTFAFSFDGPTNGANGDSFLTLTENLTFESEPAGSQVFLTDTASDVATASVDREAWTSRGAGVQTDVTNSANGWTSGIQVTDTAGGSVVDWFTKQLAAMTLGGAVRCNIRCAGSSGSLNGAIRAQIARVDSDGSNPTIWASGCGPVTTEELPASETAISFLIAGDDLAISDGQRLRIRLLVDDASVVGPLVTGFTVTTWYAGTSGGASGDTYLTFSDTLTEFVQQDRVPVSRLYPQLLAH